MLKVEFSNAFTKKGMQQWQPLELFASVVMVREVNAGALGMLLTLAQSFNAFHGSTSDQPVLMSYK
ncbi:hypothetical protein CRYUN_Cryun05aG0155300 [Craigia yunnanensis]